jgi:hypothetical protein
MERPGKNEYHSFYDGYINLVPKGDLINILENQNVQFCEFMAKVNNERGNYKYDKDKWTLKEVIGHIVDTEMIFLSRALRISRDDKTELPGFDQNEYVKNSNFQELSLSGLVEQFYHVRKATTAILSNFSKEMWSKMGNANGSNVTVRAIGYIIAGHVIHHMKIINSKYLN